jgi:hypothetical protein
MLIAFILKTIVITFSLLLIWLPKVDTLPFGLDEILSNGMSWFFYVAIQIPPLASLWEAFLWVVGFKIAMKFILSIPIVGRMFA